MTRGIEPGSVRPATDRAARATVAAFVVLALWPLVNAAVQTEFWDRPRDIIEGAIAIVLIVALVRHKWWARSIQSLVYTLFVISDLRGPYTIFIAANVGCLVLLHMPQMRRYAPRPDAAVQAVAGVP